MRPWFDPKYSTFQQESVVKMADCKYWLDELDVDADESAQATAAFGMMS